MNKCIICNHITLTVNQYCKECWNRELALSEMDYDVHEDTNVSASYDRE